MTRWLTRSLVAAVVLGAALWAHAADALYGLPLIPWATKVEEDRYRSPRDFAETLKWYDKVFVGNRLVKRHREVNLPGIKYVHYENQSQKSGWSGLNVYQQGARGEVRLYVLKRLDKPATDKAPATEAKPKNP